MVVYQLHEQGLRVTVMDPDDKEPFVELALGSEIRTLSLKEFTNFWLEMIEMGRKAQIAHLESIGKLPWQPARAMLRKP